MAVNARLAIPLTGPPATPQSSHPHTGNVFNFENFFFYVNIFKFSVNNIHPAVAASHAEVSRSRHGSGYSTQGQNTPQLPTMPIENGLPADTSQTYPHQHRSPAGSQQQPSPTVR